MKEIFNLDKNFIMFTTLFFVFLFTNIVFFESKSVGDIVFTYLVYNLLRFLHKKNVF